MPTALALNTAAHASSGGHLGRWSRCQGTGTKAVKTCSTFLLTERKRETDKQTVRQIMKLETADKQKGPQ